MLVPNRLVLVTDVTKSGIYYKYIEHSMMGECFQPREYFNHQTIRLTDLNKALL
jgi:hypothetical protein